jgi:hypothetical protein
MRIQLGVYQTPQVHNPYGRFDSRRKTLAFIEELSKELLYIKPRHGRANPRTFEFDVYEYDKGIYIVDVKGIKGYVSSDEDLLTSYWWALFLGSIRETNPSDVVDTGGTTYSLRASNNPLYSTASISYGTGTTPESFVDRTLVSRVGSISASVSVGYLSDRIRITLSGTIPSTSYELGIEQGLYAIGGATYTTLLGRKTGSWSAGTAVAWYIDFLSPWVRGVGDYIYGIHRNADVTMVRIDGTSFTARTSGDSQSGSAYLVASGDLVSWSSMLIAISNAFSLSNYYADILGTRYVRATLIHGLYSPVNDIAVNTIGLYFPVYDTTGTSQTVCILVQPLSSPVTLYASRNNLIVLRIIAF